MTAKTEEPELEGSRRIGYGPAVPEWDGNPEGWLDFKQNMMAAAVMMGLKKVMTSSGSVLRSEKGFEEKNELLYAKLVLSVGGTAKMVVREFDDTADGRGAWQALVKHYEGEGNSRLVTLMRELIRAMVRSGDNPVGYFARIEEIWRQLKGMKVDIPEQLMVAIVLANLPKEYDTLRMVVCVAHDLKFHEVKAAVIGHYRNLMAFRGPMGGAAVPSNHGQATDSGASGTVAAVQVGAKVKPCWICQSTEHQKKDCPNKKKIPVHVLGGI
jgi:hypothetical protein